jgi:hypothetical protein
VWQVDRLLVFQVRLPPRLKENHVDKIDTVALMAATIYAAAGPAAVATTDADVAMYGRVAAQAWALYDAVENQAADRHSRR